MKTKVLLSVTLMAISAAVSAQILPSPNQLENISLGKISKDHFQLISTAKVKQLSETATVPVANTKAITRANGVSYLIPEGTFWLGRTKEGAGYTGSILHAPAFTDGIYKNTSDNIAATKWYIGSRDAGEFADNDNNLIFSYGVSGENQSWAAPTLSAGNISFTLGQSNPDGSGIMTRNTNIPVITTEWIDSETIYTGARAENGNSTYLMGSDVIIEGDKMLNCLIYSPKPAAPMCVTDIFYPIMSKSGKPIPEGSKMTLKIIKADTDNEGGLVPTDEVLYEMTAGPEDIIDGFLRFQDTPKTYIMTFSNKVYDPFTNTMVAEPFMLNDAFILELSGFDLDGMDLGLMGVETTEGTGGLNSFMGFPEDVLRFYQNTNILALINGYFNVISVGETTLKAPNDGGVARTEDDQYAYTPVFTTLDWDEVSFWYDSETPDWILIDVNDRYREEYGYYALSFECDPLPAGVESRSWTFNIQSFGSIADHPITIYQGLKPSGIDKTDANSDVKIVSTADAYILSYPENVTNVSIVNVAGQTIATYELPAGGQFTVPAAELSRGLYLLKFNNNQTVKVIK